MIVEIPVKGKILVKKRLCRDLVAWRMCVRSEGARRYLRSKPPPDVRRLRLAKSSRESQDVSLGKTGGASDVAPPTRPEVGLLSSALAHSIERSLRCSVPPQCRQPCASWANLSQRTTSTSGATEGAIPERRKTTGGAMKNGWLLCRTNCAVRWPRF